MYKVCEWHNVILILMIKHFITGVFSFFVAMTGIIVSLQQKRQCWCQNVYAMYILLLYYIEKKPLSLNTIESHGSTSQLMNLDSILIKYLSAHSKCTFLLCEWTAMCSRRNKPSISSKNILIWCHCVLKQNPFFICWRCKWFKPDKPGLIYISCNC